MPRIPNVPLNSVPKETWDRVKAMYVSERMPLVKIRESTGLNEYMLKKMLNKMGVAHRTKTGIKW